MGDTRQRRQAPRVDSAGGLTADEDAAKENEAKRQKERSFSIRTVVFLLAIVGVALTIGYWTTCPVQQKKLEKYRLSFVNWWNSKETDDLSFVDSNDNNGKSGFPVPSKEKLSKARDWMKGPNPKMRLMNNDDVKYVEGGKIYLIIVGHVIDVTSGAKMYQPGTGYHGFVGRDSSRAFISGEFNEKGLIDDLAGLEPHDYLGLADWIMFYLTHENYKFVGYHIGSFFDKNGKETEKMMKFKQSVKEAEVVAEKEQDLKKLFPPCNVEWTQETGSKLWCSSMSGGIDRDWVGFPRQFFEKPDKPHRCACVHPNYLADPRVKVYEDCAINSEVCYLKPEPKKKK